MTSIYLTKEYDRLHGKVYRTSMDSKPQQKKKGKDGDFDDKIMKIIMKKNAEW